MIKKVILQPGFKTGLRCEAVHPRAAIRRLYEQLIAERVQQKQASARRRAFLADGGMGFQRAMTDESGNS